MNLIKMIVTNSPCYKAGRKIEPIGLMIHSVGTPQPDPNVFQRIWNKITADACTHAVLGADGTVIQLLPWNHRGWHARLSANNTHIGVEMTEPNTIEYISGSRWFDKNPVKTKEHVLGTYKTAVELFAYLCLMEGYDPLKKGVIVSHAEGYKLGIASNHGDPEHIWNKFGLTMDQFRKDIKIAMGVNSDDEIKAEPKAGIVKVIYEGSDGLNVRTSPEFKDNINQVVHKGEVFTVVEKIGDFFKLKSGLYIANNPKFVEFKEAPIFKSFKVKIGADVLNIREGAGTSFKDVGNVRKGEVYTIVEELNGWGRLKSGAGWISLSYTNQL